MKYLSLLTRIHFLVVSIILTAIPLAQVKAQLNEQLQFTPGGYFDKPLDQFGQAYQLQTLNIQGYNPDSLVNNKEGCIAGYFILHFETGSGFEGFNSGNIERSEVISQVFTDISNFIVSPLDSTNEKVHIWIRSIDSTHIAAPASNLLRATGSSYYLIPDITDASVGAITDGAVWRTLQTGASAYTGITTPLNANNLFFHGYMAVNFSNTSLSWNKNLLVNAGTGEIDLYTEIMDQALRLLGLVSLIDQNGQSVFGANRNYYSRYDSFLRTQTGQSLIQAADSSCARYSPLFAVNDSLLSPDCHGSTPEDYTNCLSAIYFGDSIPVYTPGCFEPGFSLSSFEDACYPVDSAYGNNLYFLLSNQNGTGASGTKRWPRQEERDALCTLGYATAGSFGPVSSNYYHTYTGTCSGEVVVAVNDGINEQGAYKWYGFEGDVIEVSGFLDQNLNTSTYSCLELIQGAGSISGQGSGTFSYTPSSAGIHLFRYTPLSAQNEAGSEGYIVLFSASSSCQPAGCNMLADGGFESATVPCGEMALANNNINCWSKHSSHFRYFGRYCNSSTPPFPLYGFTWEHGIIPTTPYVTSSPVDTWNTGSNGNDHFIGLRGGSGSDHQASIQQLLSTPLVAGNTYTISFRALVANGNPQDEGIVYSNIALTAIVVGYTAPLFNGGIDFPLALTNQLCAPMTVPAVGGGGPQWQNITQTFTINPDFPDFNTFVIGHYGPNYPNNTRGYLLIDEIELIHEPTLNLPQTTCVSIITNLEQFASHPGGTFFGTGVIENLDGTYDFIAPGTGTYDINYYIIGGACPFFITESVQGTTTNVQFEMPDIMCGISELTNLQQYVTGGASGVFTGDYVFTSQVGGSTVYTFAPEEAGQYIITYTVTDNNCEFELPQTINVFIPEEVELNFPTANCNQILEFTDGFSSIPGGDYEGEYIIPIGSVGYSFISSIVGEHIITYTVLDGNGCEISTQGIIVVEGDDITVEFPVLSCDWSLLDLEQFASVGGGSFSGEGVSQNIDGIFNFQAAYADDFVITYTALSGCSYTATITVLDPPECYNNGVDVDIDANTTWNGMNETFCSNIVVAPGISLTIQNGSELRFKEGFGIILHEGADLYVYESTITVAPGCGPFWKGIYAERETLSFIPHTYIKIFNSEISYAETGIEAKTIGGGVAIDGGNWATVMVFESSFYNNKMDIDFFGLNRMHNIIFKIVNSEFIANDDFPVTELPDAYKVLVRNVYGYFYDCRFINTRPDFLQELEFTAINCSGSNNISVLQDAYESSEISGFVRGISVSNGISSTGKYRVVGTSFNNYRNMYFRNAFTSIRENEVQNLPAEIVSEMTGIFLINELWGFIHDESNFMDIESSPYGLYLDGGLSSYLVHDNLFNLFTLQSAYTHGVIANNTGQTTNHIQKNVFNTNRRSLKFQGNNRSSDFLTGVNYRCNIFNSNTLDVLITQSIWSAEWGIPHQGSLDLDFNNIFTQSSSPFDLIIDDMENWVTSHSYHRTLTNTTNPLWEETAGIIPAQATELLGCAEISGFAAGSGSYSELLPEKTSAEIAYESTQTIYYSLLDGGDTDELITIIASTGYNDALETYYDLMGKSPALSEEAMLEAIEQYNLPNVLLAEILASNPSAAKSDKIMESLDNRLIPFDEYQRNMVLQGLNVISNKESLEGEMRMRLADRSLTLHLMIERIYMDTTIIHKVDSILPLLDETIYFNDTYLKSNLLTMQGKYSAAISIIEDAPLYHRVRNQNLIDLDVLKNVLQIEENLFTTSSDTLSSGDIILLEHALDNTTAEVSERALDLLITYAGYEYFEPILEGEGAEPRSLIKPALKKPENDILIYPNPASKLVVVEFRPAGVSQIELVDLNGKVVQHTSVNEKQHQFSLNLDKLAPGIYGIRLLSQSGAVIKQSKVVKQ